MKKYYIFIATFSLFLIISPLSDQQLQLRADENEYFNKIRKGITYFRKVYERVQSHYVEEIDPYEFVKAGIDGMLATLDPYTVFIEQEGDTRLKIITTGKYGGLGMEIGMRNDRVTVISPMDNSPAKNAGIRAGDIIVKIGGETVSSLVPAKISKRLRGTIGSEVKLTIRRPGFEDEIEMKIKRDEIIIEDVNYSDFVWPGIGYIRLTGFTEKAGEEVIAAIKDLQARGEIKSIILDLRGNSGGLLESAVEIAGIFLPKGTAVVSTRGMRDGENSFKTQSRPLLPNIPLAVLVDGGSASASEIVAGALQDLDRGIIIGTNTFGKGLVQKVYNIDKNSSTKIKVTTAKYYIPSGRCVQKEDLSSKSLVAEYPADTSLENATAYYTTNRRLVYEKGGITPDKYIEDDGVEYLVTELWRQSLPFNFAVGFHHDNPVWAEKYADNNYIFGEFLKYMSGNDFSYKIEGEKELVKFIEIMNQKGLDPQIKTDSENLLKRLEQLKMNNLQNHKDAISRLLLNEISAKYFGSKEKIRYSLRMDQQLQEALKVVKDVSTYKKILAIN